MKRSTMSGLLAAGALALSACATTTTPGPRASATSGDEECKAVTVYSASQEIRNANRTGVPGRDIDKAAGAAQIGRVAGFPPPGVRDDSVAKSDNIAGKVMRHC